MSPRRSRSRENSPSSLGGGWAALGAKADSQKPKKEKKLQQFDMFGDQEPVKKKKEVSDYKIEISKSKSIFNKILFQGQSKRNQSSKRKGTQKTRGQPGSNRAKNEKN